MTRGYAAAILAGGDGTRLRALTRALTGDDRPKQFCRLVGERSLLAETRARARRLVASERLFTVVTEKHRRFYGPELDDAAPGTVVVQPESRGTAPAILYAVERAAAVAPGRPLVLLPSDHYVSDDDAFMARVEGALEAVEARPGTVILLGIEPDRPETDYGWIEPAQLLLGPSPWPLYAVRRFWEKPGALVARRLARAGCLWNSFVAAGQPAAFRRLIGTAAPDLARAFTPLVARLGTPGETAAARAVYAALASTDFSKHVLEARAADLAVFPVSGLTWNDLGDPARVLATLAGARRQLASA
jgi:mannose-1-phosphate guanylyltransferase